MTCSVRQGAHFAFHDDRVSARVITAFQTGEQRDHFLSEVLGSRRAAPARKRALIARLEAIRRRGYDEGPSDTINGVVDICFPIFDRFGAIAALNIVYLKQRDSRTTIPAAREKLRHAAEAISKSLGWLTGEARMKDEG
jgi:DNA-binding IclR family transcriptional regulator